MDWNLPYHRPVTSLKLVQSPLAEAFWAHLSYTGRVDPAPALGNLVELALVAGVWVSLAEAMRAGELTLPFSSALGELVRAMVRRSPW